MSRLFVGTINGIPCVKATKLNTDVPWTVADNQYAKFLFNSRNQNAYVYDVVTLNVGSYSWGGSNTVSTHYLPAGTNPSTASYRLIITTNSNFNTSHMRLTALTENMGFSYPPIVEFRARSADYVYLGPRYSSTTDATARIFTFRANLPYADRFSRAPSSNASYLTSVSSVWELPATNVALPQDGANATGRMAVRLTPTHAQVARVGFDVRTAPNTGFILNSDRIPAKILASGETVVAPSTSVTVPIATTFTLTQDMYVDYNVQDTTRDLFHPPISYVEGWGTTSRNIQMDHRINVAAKTLTFWNGGQVSIRIRWILLADDAAGTTTGGTRVAYRGNDGVEDFYQIKRPGSSDAAPRFDDILLDTRFQTLRIVDEGYIPWAQFTETSEDLNLGQRRRTVTFANTGFKPFLKYTVTRGGGVFGGEDFLPWRHPEYVRFNVSGSLPDPDNWNGKTGSDSTLARIFDTSIRFYMSRDNPNSLRVQTDGNEKAQGVYYATEFLSNIFLPTGIRYYIFALPE